jgi:hypothetical protein
MSNILEKAKSSVKVVEGQRQPVMLSHQDP